MNLSILPIRFAGNQYNNSISFKAEKKDSPVNLNEAGDSYSYMNFEDDPGYIDYSITKGNKKILTRKSIETKKKVYEKETEGSLIIREAFFDEMTGNRKRDIYYDIDCSIVREKRKSFPGMIIEYDGEYTTKTYLWDPIHSKPVHKKVVYRDEPRGARILSYPVSETLYDEKTGNRKQITYYGFDYTNEKSFKEKIVGFDGDTIKKTTMVKRKRRG